MTWNYRVLRRYYPDWDEEQYGIVEVFYDKDGNIDGWTEDFVAPVGDNYASLFHVLSWYMDAMSHPVLIEDELLESLSARRRIGRLSQADEDNSRGE